MSILSRKPRTDVVELDVLRFLPPGFDDRDSPYFVPVELRGDYVALASDPRQARAADLNARDAVNGRNNVLTEQAPDGRIVTRAPRSYEREKHSFYLSAARTRYDAAVAQERRSAESRKAAEERTRCELCGEHGADPGHLSALYTLTLLGPVEPRFGVEGRPIQLHTACAAALTVAARQRVDPAAVDRARTYLDTRPITA